MDPKILVDTDAGSITELSNINDNTFDQWKEYVEWVKRSNDQLIKHQRFNYAEHCKSIDNHNKKLLENSIAEFDEIALKECHSYKIQIEDLTVKIEEELSKCWLFRNRRRVTDMQEERLKLTKELEKLQRGISEDELHIEYNKVLSTKSYVETKKASLATEFQKSYQKKPLYESPELTKVTVEGYLDWINE